MAILASRATIRTKFISPTNTRGARIKATCQAGSIYLPYPYELSGTDCHWAAAQALIQKLGLLWGPQFAIGEDDKGYTFVPVQAGANVVSVEV